MRTLLKSLMALLIVSSAIATNAADSVQVATVCKIVPEKDDHFKVIYQANERQNVIIKLYDDNSQIVYSENLNSSGFIKRFDLTNLPVGNYQVKVSAKDRVFEESIKLGEDASNFNLTLTPKNNREISFVASNDQGKAITLYILDGSKEVVYKERFEDTRQVHKRYNFNKLNSDEVSFVFYHNNQLIAEQKFDF